MISPGSASMTVVPDHFQPPSSLRFDAGVWRPASVSPVSYPDAGNDACFLVEETSYWFRHRNDAITAAIDLFPPSGPIFDIGGGNGFVSLAMERAGYASVLLEPGSGALNAVRRGVRNVIQATLEDADFPPCSIHAVGIFDVVEHVEHENVFLSDIARILTDGGRVYCTVPAGRWLWSDEDVSAGHFRRYTPASLRDSFERNGFQVEFLSHLFSWLHVPIFAFRTLPYLLGRHRAHDPDHSGTKADHSLPVVLRYVSSVVHRWELNRIQRRCSIPFGTSLLCVARRARGGA